MSAGRPAAEIMDALAAGLAAHVRSAELAEAQRAAFAFDERPRPMGPLSPRDGRHHAAAALAAASDPVAIRLLATLHDGPLPLGDLVGIVSERSDRIATAEVVNSLAAAGLVARELTADHVRLTPLGEAIVNLVDELAGRLDCAEPVGTVEPTGTVEPAEQVEPAEPVEPAEAATEATGPGAVR